MDDQDTDQVQDLFRLNFNLPEDITGKEYVDAVVKFATKLFYQSRGSRENSQANLSDQKNAIVGQPDILKKAVDVLPDGSAWVNVKAMVPFKREHIVLDEEKTESGKPRHIIK